MVITEQRPLRIESGTELIPALWKRRSVYSFDPRPVEKGVLRSLFEAARRAPSAFNEQPWRYWVGTEEDPELHERLRGLLFEGNAWAKAAPVLILSGAKTRFSINGAANLAASHDLGAANLALMLQAAEAGLASHPMGGFDPDGARELIGDPEVVPYAMIAVGHPGDLRRLSEDLIRKESARSERRSVEEFIVGPDFSRYSG